MVGRPHYDPVAQTRNPLPRNDSDRLSDPPTGDRQVAPSPRRGHSLSVIYGHVYLFGGLTEGYDCNAAVTDTLRYGSPYAGLSVEQCRALSDESNEVSREL